MNKNITPYLILLLILLFPLGCSQREKGIVTVVNNSGEDIMYWVYVGPNISTRCWFKSPYVLLKADSSVDVDIRGRFSSDKSVEVEYFFMRDKGDSLGYMNGCQRHSLSVEELDKNGWAPIKISKSAVAG